MTRRQLDVFGSFLGPKFSAEPDIITSVMHAFSENPKRGLSEQEFENLVCELCKSADYFYELCQSGMDVIKKLVCRPVYIKFEKKIVSNFTETPLV